MNARYLFIASVVTAILSLICWSTKSAYAQKGQKAVHESGFRVFDKGQLISRATFKRDAKASGNVIEIEAVNVSGGSISLSRYSKGESPVLPPAQINDIVTLKGSYISTRNLSNSGRGVVMQLMDVNYPYVARITVSEQPIEFEITEPGFWKISISVNQ